VRPIIVMYDTSILISSGIFLSLAFWLSPKKNIIVGMLLVIITYLAWRDSSAYQKNILNLFVLELIMYVESEIAPVLVHAGLAVCLIGAGILGVTGTLMYDGFSAATTSSPAAVGYVPAINAAWE
jgi:hypothetical protein